MHTGGSFLSPWSRDEVREAIPHLRRTGGPADLARPHGRPRRTRRQTRARGIIAGTLGVSAKVAEFCLVALNTVRNYCCAHHGRLWNKTLGTKPMIPRLLGDQGLPYGEQARLPPLLRRPRANPFSFGLSWRCACYTAPSPENIVFSVPNINRRSWRRLRFSI